ncbi:hypothetical protein C8F04DRAFT_1368024 [Mycena alexandri]|uniref:Uncharacterized protein n=1 Tax=Mycena alexandri TaxID=1745969 RepID=A0AAD6SM92_9AGAR|nr:hypothetical protein C8F04DRAFT_1368024 [Mycena alexandri]
MSANGLYKLTGSGQKFFNLLPHASKNDRAELYEISTPYTYEGRRSPQPQKRHPLERPFLAYSNGCIQGRITSLRPLRTQTHRTRDVFDISASCFCAISVSGNDTWDKIRLPKTIGEEGYPIRDALNALEERLPHASCIEHLRLKGPPSASNDANNARGVLPRSLPQEQWTEVPEAGGRRAAELYLVRPSCARHGSIYASTTRSLWPLSTPQAPADFLCALPLRCLQSHMQHGAQLISAFARYSASPARLRRCTRSHTVNTPPPCLRVVFAPEGGKWWCELEGRGRDVFHAASSIDATLYYASCIPNRRRADLSATSSTATPSARTDSQVDADAQVILPAPHLPRPSFSLCTFSSPLLLRVEAPTSTCVHIPSSLCKSHKFRLPRPYASADTHNAISETNTAQAYSNCLRTPTRALAASARAPAQIPPSSSLSLILRVLPVPVHRPSPV